MAGPAGVGKSVLAKRLFSEIPELSRAVTATTRPPRDGEKHGRDYYFFSDTEFEAKVQDGEFLEWVWFAGYRYGTLKHVIFSKLKRGASQLMVIDIRGAQVFRESFPQVVSIFITPPSFDVLQMRMLERNQNTPEHMAEKLEIAKEEMKHQAEFDYVVINDDFEQTVRELAHIVRKHI